MADVQPIPMKQRRQLARLLNPRSVADAMAAYYALDHPETQTKLYGYFASRDIPTGFVAVAQTGMDLFRPLVIPFTSQEAALQSLLKAALKPQRPVLLCLPVDQQSWAEAVVRLSEIRILDLYRLDRASFKSIINVLLQETETPGGRPRYEIHSQTGVRAAAGINWRGEYFAEVYVDVIPETDLSGFGGSVLAAIVERLLSEHKIALYQMEESIIHIGMELKQIGFRPTGIRTILAQAIID
jgi:hypothetical protein